MKTVTLKFEEDFHKELKIKMAQDGTTIQEYVLALVKKDMERNKK